MLDLVSEKAPFRNQRVKQPEMTSPLLCQSLVHSDRISATFLSHLLLAGSAPATLTTKLI